MRLPVAVSGIKTFRPLRCFQDRTYGNKTSGFKRWKNTKKQPQQNIFQKMHC